MQEKTNHAWRKTALVLLIINLFLLFWLQGGLQRLGLLHDEVHESQRFDQQIQSPLLHLRSSQEAPQTSASAPTASQGAAESASQPASGASANAAALSAPFVPATVALAATAAMTQKKSAKNKNKNKDKKNHHIKSKNDRRHA
jgi:hypothetical protein